MTLPAWLKQTIGLETEPRVRLTLPEPGRSLWTKTYRTVEDELKRIGKPRLGGGTLLASRWKHRKSVDIDLSIEPTPRRQGRLDRLAIPGSRFHDKMKGLGASDAQALSQGQIVVHFGDSKLDITIVNATPPRGERRATVHGHPTTVLSTTQVLSGKLARSNELLPRDAFDITTATHKAPENLAWATNRVPPSKRDSAPDSNHPELRRPDTNAGSPVPRCGAARTRPAERARTGPPRRAADGTTRTWVVSSLMTGSFRLQL